MTTRRTRADEALDGIARANAVARYRLAAAQEAPAAAPPPPPRADETHPLRRALIAAGKLAPTATPGVVLTAEQGPRDRRK